MEKKYPTSYLFGLAICIILIAIGFLHYLGLDQIFAKSIMIELGLAGIIALEVVLYYQKTILSIREKEFLALLLGILTYSLYITAEYVIPNPGITKTGYLFLYLDMLMSLSMLMFVGRDISRQKKKDNFTRDKKS